MLKGYLINLDRQPERLLHFYQQPEVSYFQRISAVDKKLLDLLGNTEFLFNVPRLAAEIGRAVSLGEVGCTLSHIKAWTAIAQDPELAEDEFAVVAEDDIRLIPRFSHYLTALLPSLKNQPVDVVILQKLGLYQPTPIALFDGGDLQCYVPAHRQAVDNDGSSLYLIRKAKARAIIKRLQSEKPY